MKYIFALPVLAFFSCTHQMITTQQTSTSTSTTTTVSIDQECFKLINENKTKEFIEKIDVCKNSRGVNGLTTIMMAIIKDNTDLVERLIEAKIDVNATEKAGITALTFAANKNNVRAVQLLRRAGARIEIVGDNLTALMMAVRNSSLELIDVMKPTTDEINIRAEDGWTAIYFGISRRDLDLVSFLLDHGACTQIKDFYKQRPIDFANELKWKEGVLLLRRKTKC